MAKKCNLGLTRRRRRRKQRRVIEKGKEKMQRYELKRWNQYRNRKLLCDCEDACTIRAPLGQNIVA